MYTHIQEEGYKCVSDSLNILCVNVKGIRHTLGKISLNTQISPWKEMCFVPYANDVRHAYNVYPVRAKQQAAACVFPALNMNNILQNTSFLYFPWRHSLKRFQ